MERVPIGEFQITKTGDEPVRSFVPNHLQPNPPLEMDGKLNQALAEAMLALGRLDGISSLLPDPDKEILERQGRRVGSLLRVHEALANQPILSLTGIRKNTGLSFPVVSEAMNILVEQGMAREFAGRRRARLFAYDEYLAILN